MEECKEITGVIVDLKRDRRKIIVDVSGNKAYLSHVDVFTDKNNVREKLEASVGKEVVTMYVINSKDFWGFDREYPCITEIRSNDQIYFSIDSYNLYGHIERVLAIISFVLFQVLFVLIKFDLFWDILLFLSKKSKK